jgi:hypothetical protein
LFLIYCFKLCGFGTKNPELIYNEFKYYFFLLVIGVHELQERRDERHRALPHLHQLPLSQLRYGTSGKTNTV